MAIPATVIYAKIYQHRGPTDLYCSILEKIGHPLSHVETLRDLRSRTWGTLREYDVRILIIGNADYLTLEPLNELINILPLHKCGMISLNFQRFLNGFKP
ncbi:MAG: ATP-binding protein [Richelia sp.]|nr:ATP-binding protein [Richelia sp.]